MRIIVEILLLCVALWFVAIVGLDVQLILTGMSASVSSLTVTSDGLWWSLPLQILGAMLFLGLYVQSRQKPIA